MDKGIVFNIQRFCVHDGPGIRTSVFLKGCPLSCKWCHNPEGLSPKKQIMFSEDKCRMCGACAKVCERHIVNENGHTILRETCAGCGKCAEACIFGALEVAGKEMTAQEVLDTVMRDEPFYKQSGGGMTLTGGEPTMQGDFALALARLAKEKGLHVAMETSGFCARERFRAIAEYVDLFLFDIKETDAALHREYTGQDNALILENLAALREMGKQVILRCPIIPGFNDRDEHFLRIARLAEENENVEMVHIEPYHPLGLSKAKKLGRTSDDRLGEHMVPKDIAAKWAERVQQGTSKKVIVS